MTQEVTQPAYRARTFQRFVEENRELLTIYGILFIIMLIGTVLSSQFRTTTNFFNVLRQAVALGMVSIGQTFVILSGGIDLSVGAAISLVAVYTAGLMKLYPTMTLPIVLLMLISLVHGLAYALLPPLWSAPDEPMLFEYAALVERLNRVKVPTLVVMGTKDPDFPNPAAEFRERWAARPA